MRTKSIPTNSTVAKDTRANSQTVAQYREQPLASNKELHSNNPYCTMRFAPSQKYPRSPVALSDPPFLTVSSSNPSITYPSSFPWIKPRRRNGLLVWMNNNSFLSNGSRVSSYSRSVQGTIKIVTCSVLLSLCFIFRSSLLALFLGYYGIDGTTCHSIPLLAWWRVLI